MASGFYLRAVRLARRVRLQDRWGVSTNTDEGSGPSTIHERDDQEQHESDSSSDADYDPNESECELGQEDCANKEKKFVSQTVSPPQKEENKIEPPFDHEICHMIKYGVSPNGIYSKSGPVSKDGMVSSLTMLSGRELNRTKLGRWSRAECCHMASRHLPNKDPRVIDSGRSRVYVGRFSSDGSLFVGGFQEHHIRVYNTDKMWSIKKDILASYLRWTVTDTALSNDQCFLIYSTISPIVHLVGIGQESGVTSLANITDIHEGLDFSMEPFEESSLGLYSVQFSRDGLEIVAGSNKNSIYVYDLVANKPTLCLHAHKNDVNTVTYADESNHLLFSGSDDHTCKVWDRRCLTSRALPAGVLVGHLEGITFIDSRGDGRYFISNGKEQTIKLWDIRKMSSSTPASKSKGGRIPSYNWDYRWMDYPGAGKNHKHPNDQSLMTYEGHNVRPTLIRCYFSPMFTTGQKYIYTGSFDGCVYIYDLLTGQCAGQLRYHKTTVRDCSWHPFIPKLVTSSWDGKIVEWDIHDRHIPKRSGNVVH